MPQLSRSLSLSLAGPDLNKRHLRPESDPGRALCVKSTLHGIRTGQIDVVDGVSRSCMEVGIGRSKANVESEDKDLAGFATLRLGIKPVVPIRNPMIN